MLNAIHVPLTNHPWLLVNVSKVSSESEQDYQTASARLFAETKNNAALLLQEAAGQESVGLPRHRHHAGDLWRRDDPCREWLRQTPDQSDTLPASKGDPLGDNPPHPRFRLGEKVTREATYSKDSNGEQLACHQGIITKIVHVDGCMCTARLCNVQCQPHVRMGCKMGFYCWK